MPTSLCPYRRAVLGMGTSGVDRSMLRAAAEFARLLELEMLGVFIEDRSLLGLAALPFARELRLPGQDWQALQPQRLDDELRAAARQARQTFEREVGSQGVACRFEVRRGDPVTLVSDVAQSTDVLIVVEPLALDALAAASQPARRAALASAAAVLFLPRSGMPLLGPVAAVASSQSDMSFQLAAHIAAARGEKALAIPLAERTSASSLVASLERLLGNRRECLLVMRREGTTPDEMPLEVVSRRQTPVLLVTG